jgi:hypothetical protein
MIAYNKTWLANLRVQAEMKKELQNNNISDAEFKAISEKYPVGFYTPGLFARVGLFILTCIVISFADGLLTLIAANADIVDTTGWFVFLALLSYTALELMVKAKHYRSGVDDALLFISGCLMVAGFAIMLTGHHTNYLALSFMIFLLNLYFSIRFADMLMGALCCAAFIAVVFFGWTKYIPGGLTTVPFAIMLASAGLYWIANRCSNREEFINYQNCLIIAQIIGLITLYAAGNYYVVQTLSNELNGDSGKPIPFGTIFWIWTIAIPFIYVGFGIRKKDMILLRSGLLLVAISVITFRTYYHILPTDVMLTISGAALLIIAYAITKYLKTPKYGFTYAEPDEANMMDHLKVESLIVAETFSTAPAAPTNDGVKFGGGDFGGGGSSDSF